MSCLYQLGAFIVGLSYACLLLSFLVPVMVVIPPPTVDARINNGENFTIRAEPRCNEAVTAEEVYRLQTMCSPAHEFNAGGKYPGGMSHVFLVAIVVIVFSRLMSSDSQPISMYVNCFCVLIFLLLLLNYQGKHKLDDFQPLVQKRVDTSVVTTPVPISSRGCLLLPSNDEELKWISSLRQNCDGLLLTDNGQGFIIPWQVSNATLKHINDVQTIEHFLFDSASFCCRSMIFCLPSLLMLQFFVTELWK